MSKITENAVKLTRELISIPSESSEAIATTAPCEAGIIAVLQRLCSENNIPWHLQEINAGRSNFIASFPKPGAARIIFLAHMDTVSGAGMNNPFLAKIKDNKIWGRGACDDKGPLATLFSTLIGLKNRGVTMNYDVTLVGSVDEECSMAGSYQLAAKNPAGWDLCVALEPSNLQPISTHIGVYRCRILPNPASNNILKQIKTELGGLKDAIDKQRHSQLGYSKMTVTLLGNDVNTQNSEESRLLVDIRLLPGQNPAKIHTFIKQVVGNKGRVIPLTAAMALNSNPENYLIKTFQNSIQSQNLPAELIAVPFPSDCSQLTNSGACLVWGPGDYKVAHGSEEFIDIDQLAEACRVLSHFLCHRHT